MSVRATGVGSHPGDDQPAFDDALRTVLRELAEEPGLPYLPEVPGRGAVAAMTGRTLAVVAELGADLQPAGWRLTGGGSGVDHRRARSLLAQDLDALEEHAAGYAGDWKVQLTGPWTLASTVERPRGDRILADHGARRELAQALAEGVGTHVQDLRRRLPDVARLMVQVDEPALAAVHQGQVPTASGFHRHRSVDRPELTETLAGVLDAIRAAGAEPWVHSCAADTPWDLVRAAGATGLLLDRGTLAPRDLDQLAEALEAGIVLGLGVLPGLAPRASAAPSGDTVVVEGVLRWLDLLGLDPAGLGDRLVLTPACGFAAADPAWAQRALRLLRGAARGVADSAAG